MDVLFLLLLVGLTALTGGFLALCEHLERAR
jgi:hypothetical protein